MAFIEDGDDDDNGEDASVVAIANLGLVGISVMQEVFGTCVAGGGGEEEERDEVDLGPPFWRRVSVAIPVGEGQGGGQ